VHAGSVAATLKDWTAAIPAAFNVARDDSGRRMQLRVTPRAHPTIPDTISQYPIVDRQFQHPQGETQSACLLAKKLELIKASREVVE